MSLLPQQPSAKDKCKTLPYISFIVPVRRNYTGLLSMLKNIGADIGAENEVIVVHDSDDPLPVDFSPPHWVKIVTASTRGLGPARNFALSQASGHLIAFIDADDDINIPNLTQVAKEMDARGCDLALSNYANISQCGGTFVHDTAPHLANRPCVVRDVIDKSHLKTGFYFCWNKVYRRSFLLANKITFPSGEYEDVFWSVNTIALAKSIYVTEEVFYTYRFDVSSAVNRPGAKHMDILLQYSHVLSDLQNRNIPSEMLKIIRLQAVRHCLFIMCKTERLDHRLRRELYYQLIQRKILNMEVFEILREPELSLFNRVIMAANWYPLLSLKRLLLKR